MNIAIFHKGMIIKKGDYLRKKWNKKWFRIHGFALVNFKIHAVIIPPTYPPRVVSLDNKVFKKKITHVKHPEVLPVWINEVVK